MSSQYDFDTIIDRHHTGAMKTDVLCERYGREDLIPLWIADMDFAVAPCITDALVRRLQHPVYGYAEAPALPPKAEALAYMQALCRAYYPQFAATCPGGAMPKIAVRDMNTRWGSCSLRTGTLAFARRLCAMPLPAQEYVVVHEFCHFAHPDHSPAFWAAVAEVLPDYKQRERMLKLR